MPTLKLRKALAAAPAGAVVRLLADDPMARVDVPHFAVQAGCIVLDSAPDGAGFSFRVRKPD